MSKLQAGRPLNPKRVFYAAGPGDAISAHKNWVQGLHDPTEVSITFSSQIEQYCRDVGAALYLVCYHGRRDLLKDGDFTIEHLPKFWPNAGGALYHVRELFYGLMLLWRAVWFRADVAILDSGCTHYFWQSLFKLCGIEVVPVLHNALWPEGFRPTGRAARLVEALDRPFWRRVPLTTLCVSPTCSRQVEELAGPDTRPLLQIRAQFDPDYFARIPPPPSHAQRPFTIMFIGRVVEAKGVFDIAVMAKEVEKRAPGRVRWIICGGGGDLERLKERVHALDLGGVIDIRGWTSLDDLARVYAAAHCAIVPTRSAFIEGLAMTAAEAALAGRPVITSRVVPALEVLRPACVEATTNDPGSYVEQILKLIDDPAWYQRMIDACPEVSAPFLDRRNGLTEVLKRVLNDAGRDADQPENLSENLSEKEEAAL